MINYMDIFNQILKKSHLKVTKPRLEVLKYLKKQKMMISARELSKKIKTIDQASVYRILKLFEKLDIVHTEILKREKLYCLSDSLHHHIICRKCGYSEKFKCTHEKYPSFKNFSNINHRLTLTGLCNKCKS